MKLVYLCLLIATAVICTARQSYALPPDKLRAWINSATQKLRLDKHCIENEIQTTLDAASKLRGEPCIVDDVFISNSLVLKICFPDGDCWAAKWGSKDQLEEIFADIKTLDRVEHYCPHIPVSKMKGWNIGNHLVSYFTEWVEGVPLTNRTRTTLTPSESGVFEAAIPPQLITALAEFVFNLSTCSIPVGESIAPNFEHPNHEVHKMQNDHSSYTVQRLIQQSVMNATTWARCQFINCYFLHDFPIPGPYDGLDVLLLLSWILKTFSILDSRNEPMVLHYWDLSLANIIVTGEDQIWYPLSTSKTD